MGTHPIFESDFDCLTDLNEMKRLPPLQGQSTLKQLESIANEADQSATVISADQSASLTAADQSTVPEKKPRRRRRKKKPDQSQSTVEVNHELPAISAGQFNPQPEINPQPVTINPPSEPYKPVDWNMRMLEEQQKVNQLDTILGASVLRPVNSLGQLRNPEKLRVVKNSVVEPHQETVYVQTARGFKAASRSEANRTLDTNKNHIPTKEEDAVSYGEGLATFIRNLARFSLGIITGYTAIVSAQLQMLPKDERVINTENVMSFEIEALVISIMCCVCGIGALSNVDPIGRGGLGRLFKFDPASLINISVLLAVLLSAVADVLIHQDQPDSGDLVVTDGVLTVYWLRFSMLLIGWAAMSFTESPGGALFYRFKEQNRIEELTS